jgi:tetratricopeptide (TPR) repeat protein
MKRKFYYTCFFVLALILSFGTTVPDAKAQGYGDRNKPSEGGSYGVQGKIVLPGGQPAANVKVGLSGSDFTNTATQTDNDGTFRFSGLPAGNYYLAVKGTNLYEAENEPLIIDRIAPQGQTFNVVIYLRAPGTKKSENKVPTNALIANVPKDALKKYQSAGESVQKNDLKAAGALLDEAIAIYPDFALAYNEKGVLLLKQNELDKALESFVKAIQIKPDYFEAKLNFGYTLLNKKDYEKSELVFRDVLRQKADVPIVHMYLGMALINLKKIDAAEASLKQAISLKGGDNLPLAHRYLAGIYMQKKRNAEAAAELQKYLDLAPKAADADKIKTMIADLKKQG